MDQLCRVCMDNSVTLVDIFAERQQQSTDHPSPSLAEILNEFCEVHQEDCLPQNICLSCVLAAQNAYKFKRTFEDNKQKLLKLLYSTRCADNSSALPFVEAIYNNDRDAVNLSNVKAEPLNEDEAVTNENDVPLKNKKTTKRPTQKRQTSKLLNRRMPQSNGERPYKCKFCEKGFDRKYILGLHEK